MPSIVTVTFSPCIDKSTSVQKLMPEKKLKCATPKLEPGGGGINVARAIKKLGGNAVAIYPAGGHTGKFFKELVEAEGIDAIVIETKNETRENIIVVENASGQQFRFGMPAAEILEQEWLSMLQTLESLDNIDYIVASGSLPPGMPTDIYARIADIAKKKKSKLIVDTSGKALELAVKEGVYLVKPNLAELSTLAGKEFIETKQIGEAARILIEKYRCEAVVVSMGAEGAMLVTRTIEKKFAAPPVEKKSTVGAGDSMVAGIVYALTSGYGIELAVQFGVACGTAATMHAGTELCRREDVDNLVKVMKATA